MTADPVAPVRLAIHDPAELAWGAQMVQEWLARRRALDAAADSPSPALLPESDHTATVGDRGSQPPDNHSEVQS